jgi:hypothetical protein
VTIFEFQSADGPPFKVIEKAFPMSRAPLSIRVKGKRYKKVTIPSACAAEAWKGLTINKVTYTLGTTTSTCGSFAGLWPYP